MRVMVMPQEIVQTRIPVRILDEHGFATNCCPSYMQTINSTYGNNSQIGLRRQTSLPI